MTITSTAAIPAPVPLSPWAAPLDAMHVAPLPAGVVNANVEGRRLCSPLEGFGRTWRKTYRIALEGTDATAEQVVARWKDRFACYWPSFARFHAPAEGIAPGTVVVLNSGLPRLPFVVATGIRVLYVDDTSFSFMSVQGHVLAGLITFSAARTADGATEARIDVIIRGQSPLSELALACGGHAVENAMWRHVLRALAADHGVTAAPETTVVCLDRRRWWRHWRNVRHDAVLGSLRRGWRIRGPHRSTGRAA